MEFRDNKLLWNLLQVPVAQSFSSKEELLGVFKSKRRKQFLDYIDVRNPSGLFSFTKSVNKSAIYLPTTSLLMLKKIRRQFPLHQVILADFEELEGNKYGQLTWFETIIISPYRRNDRRSERTFGAPHWGK